MAQISSKYKSVHRRKRFASQIIQIVKNNSTVKLNAEFAADLIKYQGSVELIDSPIAARYAFLDSFSINYHILRLCLNTDPNFAMSHNESCKGRGYAILNQYDCSMPAIATRILQQMAYDIMDYVLLKRYETYFRSANIICPIEESDRVVSREPIAPYCSATCCSFGNDTNFENIVKKPKINIVEEINPYRTLMMFINPSYMIESKTSFAFLVREQLNTNCISLNIPAKDFLNSLSRNHDSTLCETSVAMEFLFRACNIAVNSNVDVMSNIASFWSLAMAQMFWVQDYLMGLQTIERLETFAINFLTNSPNLVF